MARDINGTYTRISNSFTVPVTNTVILPAHADAFFDELETEMTDSLSRTGKGGMSADLDMNNNDINEIKTTVFQGSTSGTTTVIATAVAGTTTLTLPAATDTLVGKATTDTFTNKTYDTAGTGNSFSINGVAATANTGTGAVARATSPTFVTPTLGAATATSINGNTFTTGTYTLTGTAGKTFTFSNTLTLAGSDGTTLTFQGTDTYIGRATTDTLTNKTFDTAGTGNSFSIAGVAATANTGTGSVVRATSPTLVTPVLGVATATSINGATIDAQLFSNIPQNSQSAAYTLVATDAQKHILHPSSDNNARTFTIPANASVAFAIGTAITFVNKINTVTIAITTDTLTFAGPGTTGSRSLAANGMATAIKIGTTEWMISGSGLT